jgi:hypothetical protein
MLFAMVKPFISERTATITQVLTGESKWKPVLLKSIPADQLPVKLGGTGTLAW